MGRQARFRQLMRILLVFASFMSGAVLSASASAGTGETKFYKRYTDKGCVFWEAKLVDNEKYDKAQGNTVDYVWEGPACAKNQTISGQGKLTLNYVEGGVAWWRAYEGLFVDGAFEGVLSVWTSYNPQSRGETTYRGGCNVENTYMICTPHESADLGDGGRSAGDNIRPPSGPGPIMEEPWNGVGKPPKSTAPASKVGVRGRAKDRPVPHLSDDQKVLAEMLRQQRQASSPRSEADVRFEAAQLEYEQKLAAQQKAVAEYEAAERQVAADKAAAAARSTAAQQEFAQQQAAYQAEQDRYAREQAEYQAKLTGQPLQPSNSTSGAGASGSSQVPPLRPNEVLEAHNPANDATNCLKFITSDEYERYGVTSSIMGAAFRNSCPFPVDTKWCIGADRCARGYDNIATMPASADRGISYDRPAPGMSVEYHWAGCRKGFAYRPDFAGTLRFACK